MTLPDTFLVGAPKAGTTSLSTWLGSHPDMHVSVPKEPYFWASDYPNMSRHYGFHDRGNYEALYDGRLADGARRRLDGSTTYLYSREAVPAILAAVPHAKFIVALRNPVDLLASYHGTQLVALNEDERDFATAWRRSLAGRGPGCTPLDPKLVDYPRVGALGAALSQLLTRVSPQQVHAVVFDELTKNPAQVWDEITVFLELSPEPRPAFTAHNPSDKTFRSPTLRRLTHRPPRALAAPVTRLRQWSRTTQLPAVAIAKRQMWRAEARPGLQPEVRAEVASHFRSDVQMLERLIGRDLAAWRA